MFTFFKDVPSLNLLFFSHLHVTDPFFYFYPLFFIAKFLANFVVFIWSSRCLSKYPYLASISISFYSTCLVVLVVYVPYWILVGTLHHLVEFSVVTRPLHSIKKEKLEHTSSVLESPLLWWCHCAHCRNVGPVDKCARTWLLSSSDHGGNGTATAKSAASQWWRGSCGVNARWRKTPRGRWDHCHRRQLPAMRWQRANAVRRLLPHLRRTVGGGGEGPDNCWMMMGNHMEEETMMDWKKEGNSAF